MEGIGAPAPATGAPSMSTDALQQERQGVPQGQRRRGEHLEHEQRETRPRRRFSIAGADRAGKTSSTSTSSTSPTTSLDDRVPDPCAAERKFLSSKADNSVTSLSTEPDLRQTTAEPTCSPNRFTETRPPSDNSETRLLTEPAHRTGSPNRLTEPAHRIGPPNRLTLSEHSLLCRCCDPESRTCDPHVV